MEQIFKNLPKPVEWLSFLNHDLPLLIDFCEEVADASVKHHLNKSQTRAKLKEASEEEFQRIVTPVCRAGHGTGRKDQTRLESEPAPIHKDLHKIDLRDLSAREIEEVARKAANKEIMHERNRPRISPSLNLEVKILLMGRLDIPADCEIPQVGCNYPIWQI